MTERQEISNIISPHLKKVKEIQERVRKGLPVNSLCDITPEGTADIEDLDNWVKEIIEKD